MNVSTTVVEILNSGPNMVDSPADSQTRLARLKMTEATKTYLLSCRFGDFHVSVLNDGRTRLRKSYIQMVYLNSHKIVL